MEKTELMTGYEKRIFSGKYKTAADLLKDNQMVANTLKECLGVEVDVVLETGEHKNVPIIYQLVAKLLAHWCEHPEKIDLKVLSNVLGETKQEINIETKTAAEMFRGVTAGSRVDGTSS